MRRGVIWLVVALVTCVYLLSMSGRQASPDEEVFYRQAETYAWQQRLDLAPIGTVPPGHYTVTGVGSRTYSIYGPTLLAAHLPLVVLGRQLPASAFVPLRTLRDQPFAEVPFDDMNGRWAFALAGPLAAALVLVFVVRLARHWQLSPAATVVAVLVAGLATPLWAYTKSAFRDVPLAAMMLAGLTETMVACRCRSWRRAALAGALLGLAFVAKDQAIVQGGLAAVYVAACIGAGGVIAVVAGFVAASLPILVFKWAAAGALGHASGYPLLDQLSTPFFTGFTGLLFSPGKGLLFFAPVAVVALLGCRERWRADRGETAWLLVNLLSMVAVASVWWFWHGGLSWGPRLLLPLMPWLAVLAVCGVAAAPARSAESGRAHEPLRRWRMLFVVCVVAGLLVNAAGLALDWHLYYVLQEARYGGAGATEEEIYGHIAFTPADSMILFGWRAAGLLTTVPPPDELHDSPIAPAWYVMQRSRELLILEAWRLRHWSYLALVAVLCVAVLVLGGAAALLGRQKMPRPEARHA